MTKSKARQSVKYKFAGTGSKPVSLAISGLPGPKHFRQSHGMALSHMVENRNPCVRKMRELHTVEIRNKRTKELVDLEVSGVVIFCYSINLRYI
jgi:hypothetical protein